MSHPYSDACPCGDCTEYFNLVVMELLTATGMRLRGKEENMTAKKPSKKKLKSKSKTKKLITK